MRKAAPNGSNNIDETTVEIDNLFRESAFKINYSHIDKGNISYIGSTNIDNLSQLRNNLSSRNYSITDISTPRYEGLFFITESGLNGLVISPRKIVISIDQRVLNDSREMELTSELRAFGTKYNIESLACFDESSALLSGENIVISETLNMLPIQVLYSKFFNTHSEYKRYFRRYMENESIFTYGLYASSIEINCWIYFLELRIISELLIDQSISLHEVIDDNSSLGHFSLLAGSLSPQNPPGISFSDICISCVKTGWINGRFIRQITKNNPGYTRLTCRQLDTSADINISAVSDVTVINNYTDTIIPSNVLRGIWEKTNKILIIHTEEKPINAAPGKNVVKNADYTDNPPFDLPGATPLSNDLYTDGKPVIDLGFSVMVRK